MSDQTDQGSPPADGDITGRAGLSVADDSDNFDLLQDGRARFVIDGKTYTLRRPRLGEYRDLRQLMIDAVGLAPEHQLDHMVAWVGKAFGQLSDRALPDSLDEWPAWVGIGGFQALLMTHWREVPLGRGEQEKAAG